MPDSVYKQSLDEIVTRIEALGITGVSAGSIALRKFPWDDHYIHKGITVSPVDEVSNRPGEGTNERDEIGYKCLVTYVRGTSRGWSSDIQTITDFRQKVRREFNNKRLTTVSATDVNHVICRVVHEDVEMPSKYQKNYDASRLAVVCWFLEPRSN